YTSYVRRGKVVNGRPDGHWTISFITDDKKPKEIRVYDEKYSNGELLTYNLTALFYDYFIPYDDFVIVPSEFFNVAEFFIINNCSFDEYSGDRKSTRLNSSHVKISYAVFCLKKKKSTKEQKHD